MTSSLMNFYMEPCCKCQRHLSSSSHCGVNFNDGYMILYNNNDSNIIKDQFVKAAGKQILIFLFFYWAHIHFHRSYSK